MAMQRNLKPWQVSMYCGTVGELDRGIGGDNDVPIDQLIGREQSRILVYHTMLCLVLGTRKHQAYQMLLEANVKLVENRSWDDSFIKPQRRLSLWKWRGGGAGTRARCEYGWIGGEVQDRREMQCCVWTVPGERSSLVC
jgi:hypothetical protein